MDAPPVGRIQIATFRQRDYSSAKALGKTARVSREPIKQHLGRWTLLHLVTERPQCRHFHLIFFAFELTCHVTTCVCILLESRHHLARGSRLTQNSKTASTGGDELAPLLFVHRIVMPSDISSCQIEHQTENRNPGSEVVAHVQHGYIKGQQAETTSKLLATFRLAIRYPLAARKPWSHDFVLILFAMVLSTALLFLYWCPITLAVPAARNLTAEGWHRKTQLAVDVLQDWYNFDTGLWETTGWWNAANILNMLGNCALVNPNFKDHFIDIAQNTHAKAPSFKGQIL